MANRYDDRFSPIHIHEDSKDEENKIKPNSKLNKTNRKISSAIGNLFNSLVGLTQGLRPNNKVDELRSEFDLLLQNEIESLNDSKSSRDLQTFLGDIFNSSAIKNSSARKEIEDLFNSEDDNLLSSIVDRHKNRLNKLADIHEVAEQLAELRESVKITRNSITMPDIVDGHISRTLTVKGEDEHLHTADYISILNQMETKFDLHKKIKNFIVPKTLEYGEYYAVVTPFSKVFHDLMMRKKTKGINVMESANDTIEPWWTVKTLTECVNKDERKNLDLILMEGYESYSESRNGEFITKKAYAKEVNDELTHYMNNITICTDPVPMPILENGIAGTLAYKRFKETNILMEDISNDSLFYQYMNPDKKGATDGFILDKDKKNEFEDIRDCHLKLVDPLHLIPLKLMSEEIGYCYIIEEDINEVSPRGPVASRLYGKAIGGDKKDTITDRIAEAIVRAFDKDFLNDNKEFKNTIIDAINYFNITKKKLRFQFIPKEYVVRFKVNEDENGNGTSILEPALTYAMLYLTYFLFKLVTAINNSNDTRVFYIRNSGIDKNIINKVYEIVRKQQARYVNINDVFSYTSVINKIGQGQNMYVPTGEGNERGIEGEILQGQDVQFNADILEMLRKAFISATGVPDVLLNYIHEAEFAKTIELANNKYQGMVVSNQMDFNPDITRLYKLLAKYSTNIPSNVIDSINFNFTVPKISNNNQTNELISAFMQTMDFLVTLYFGQNPYDNEENIPKIERFKKELAKERLPMLRFEKIDELFKLSQVEGTQELLATKKEESIDYDAN